MAIYWRSGRDYRCVGEGVRSHLEEYVPEDVTENYPHEPVHFQPRYRGSMCCTGMRRAGKVRGMLFVAAACQANCIYIEAAENTDTNRISAARVREGLQH